MNLLNINKRVQENKQKEYRAKVNEFLKEYQTLCRKWNLDIVAAIQIREIPIQPIYTDKTEVIKEGKIKQV